MLIPRELDDQRFEDIMHEAVGRLPWLCPQWTDHNAHDPGITLLELMAWYKEMQQYQMDQLTPSLRRGLSLIHICASGRQGRGLGTGRQPEAYQGYGGYGHDRRRGGAVRGKAGARPAVGRAARIQRIRPHPGGVRADSPEPA